MSIQTPEQVLQQAKTAIEEAMAATEYHPEHPSCRRWVAAIASIDAYLSLPAAAVPTQQPVAWTVAGEITDWSRDFSAYRTQTYVRPVFASPAPAAAPEQQQQDIRDGSALSASAPSAEHAQLMKFYGVDSLAALVDKQAHHVERLQAKLPPTPNIFAPQRVREG